MVVTRAEGADLHIGLVVHPSKVVDESARTVVAWAREHDAEVVVRPQDAARLGTEVTVLDEPGFLACVDAVVSLGGDGTMLGAMRLVAGRPVPVIGVNHGNVGFLVEVEPAALPDALDRIGAGDHVVEPHSCIDADHDGVSGSAFNDLVLCRSAPGASVVADLVVDGAHYGYYRCDALVLSTPTGSTAYNYAAGGPVVSPAADVLTITPVAPMSGVSRSIVLPAGDTVALHLDPSSRSAELQLDGTRWGDLGPDATLSARLRADAAQVVRLDPDAHARRSRITLSLLDLPLRPEQLVELLPADLQSDPVRLREVLRRGGRAPG
jgi:NAD+ kinase